MRWICAVIFWATAVQADNVASITAAAQNAFDSMPQVRIVPEIAEQCGATEAVDNRVAYCTTQNVIFVADASRDTPQTGYLLGHAFGHAVQVRHGVADVALRAIRNRPDDEVMLRGFVERQVDCIAGFILQRAGVTGVDLAALFTSDPLDHPHWGRDPLRIGPVVDVPLAARADWFDIGQQGNIAACTPGEFTSRLLVRALKSN